MRCEQVQELLSAHSDDALPIDERRAVIAHMATCAACAGASRELRGMRQAIASLDREPMPGSLRRRIAAEIAEAERDDDAPLIHRATVRWYVPVAWMRQAAVLVFACGLTALGTWHYAGGVDRVARIEHDVLAAHVRSLLQDSPIQVASADSHTVKPWLVGRVDFAPDVKDLSADGFALLGGRLDFIDGRRVATTVYQRRLHMINVFTWLAPTKDSVAPGLVIQNGYNMITWSTNGVTRAAISDLNAEELWQLQRRL